MRLCNDTITVFHASVVDQAAAYAPTVIGGASWYAADADVVDPRGGLAAANRVTVRIPAGAMPGGLEIAPGDLIVKGEVAGGGWTPAALKRRFGSGCMTVLAVADNRRAPNGAHVRLVGA